MLNNLIKFCLENKLVVILLILFTIGWGLYVMPFDIDLFGLDRDPVPVDAIPDIGENQQIVFTKWMGRSPQDVEDQITYPLTVALLGVPEVKTIRSYSFFGFSSIYVIFNEDVEFYWSRSRLLEKLNALPAGTLPPGTRPALGPDATALGQIFWYTLEGYDEQGNPTGGWDLDELRSVQDWTVRYGLLAAEGVSEVASVGGFVREYQVDVDPDAMRAYGVTLQQVFNAVRKSNIDVGARTIEINRAEYVIRGLGFIKSPADIEKTVIKMADNVPIYIKNIAHVGLGPALRRGALNKEGAEAVGGVVVVRYGENPLKVIKNVKKKIEEISAGLPVKTLPDGRISQVRIVPFYDRTKLIHETLDTLNNALSEEILVTVIVVIVMVMHLTSSVIISGLLPLAILMCFIGMRYTGVDANIMALSGIAIAIGTMVDMGIIVCENILKHLKSASGDENRMDIIFKATSEVGSAVLTAILTTIVSFLPVFTMTGPEGKLFKPLAFTKTYALLASVIVALTIIPALAHIFFRQPKKEATNKRSKIFYVKLISLGVAIILGWKVSAWMGLALTVYGVYFCARKFLLPKISNILPGGIQEKIKKYTPLITNSIVLLIVGVILAEHWLPLGMERGILRNIIFVGLVIGLLLGSFKLLERFYGPMLKVILEWKAMFLTLVAVIVVFGVVTCIGFEKSFGFIPASLEKIGINKETVRSTALWSAAKHKFPGLGKEFMPPLDEGSYLYMPTTMPHASIGEAMDVLNKQNIAIRAIPEIESVVGKIGRVESSLDPAPISMIETVINYKSEYVLDPETGKYKTDEQTGKPIRQWREHIKKPDDIWKEILKAAEIPGTTSAPRLQPIAARIVMLQSGMRAPMGVKIKGDSLEQIEKVGFQIEKFLKEVPSVEPLAVIADRIVGKPYLEIDFDREAIARYGVSIQDVQNVVEVAIGGKRITTTVEGRERYPVRVRYLRELRDSIESLGQILIPASGGLQIPITQLAEINFVRGPMVIKSEDTFLTGYVLFDMRPGYAEVDVVQESQKYLKEQENIFQQAFAQSSKKAVSRGRKLTPEEINNLPGLNLAGTNYVFAGSYEHQVRSEKKLMIVLPVALFIIFLILYFQFKSTFKTMIVFSGIFVAWSGGFIMVWLYAQDWFLNFSMFGVGMRELFRVHPINLSVAVWVGFIALFGIASDNGVVIATYLDQAFARRKITSIKEIREATLEAGLRRIRPCLMTAGTTILALLPVLSSTGRGADVMVPMAIPSFGGMMLALITVFIVPVLYCLVKEIEFKLAGNAEMIE